MFNTTITYRPNHKRTANSTNNVLNLERIPSPAAAIKSTKPNSQTNDEPLIHNYAKTRALVVRVRVCNNLIDTLPY